MPRSRRNVNEMSEAIDMPKRRQRGIQSELKFIEAANVVFWDYGFSSATISQIVSESGLSVGSFYHQFTDKYDLLKLGIENLRLDFNRILDTIDLSASKNGDLFTMWCRLTMAGQKLATRHRGIYRAITEISKNDVRAFGSLIDIGPLTSKKIFSELKDYPEMNNMHPQKAMVEHAVQIMTVSLLQSSLGLAPLFPRKKEEFARLIARAACGAMGHSVAYDAKPQK